MLNVGEQGFPVVMVEPKQGAMTKKTALNKKKSLWLGERMGT
jgi:hypothetical protein